MSPRFNRRTALKLLGAVGSAAVLHRPMPAHASPALDANTADLDDDASQWGTYIDPPGKRLSFVVDNVDSADLGGRALRLAVADGDPYTNPYIYRKLNFSEIPGLAEATAFELSFRYQFSPTVLNSRPGGSQPPSTVKAIELTMNKWTPQGRYEWALRYLVFPDGTPLTGPTPTWQIWDGSAYGCGSDGSANGPGWQDLGIRQRLDGGVPHSFSLRGDIRGGQVHYVSFTSDDRTSALGQSFPPTPCGKKDLARFASAAFQLDSNYRPDPIECLFEQVQLSWFNQSPW